MANTYVQAAFGITMSREDASIICDAEKACAIIEEADAATDLAPGYDRLGLPFRKAFPARDGNPFGAFFEIFDDPVFPMFDCDIEYGLPDASGMCRVIFSGDQFGIDQVAKLLFAGCKSALPCGFEYAYHCDSLRLGEFGGGAAIITACGITHYSTARIIHDALTPPIAETDEEGDHGYVLAVRDPDHGLSFWSDTGGYGRLAEARIFSEAEAGSFIPPVFNAGTQWLTMPRPLASPCGTCLTSPHSLA